MHYQTGHPHAFLNVMYRGELASALNQVLFALNETYCLNEKRAPERIDSFPDAPRDYQNLAEAILWPKDGDPASSIRQPEALCEDVNDLIQRCD